MLINTLRTHLHLQLPTAAHLNMPTRVYTCVYAHMCVYIYIYMYITAVFSNIRNYVETGTLYI